MKSSGLLTVTLFVVLAALVLALTGDNSLTARGDTGWGNTDWDNTDWDRTVQKSQSGYLKKITLGIKNPDGSCAIVVTWDKSIEEAISAVANNCQGCKIEKLMDGNSPNAVAEYAGEFCQ